LQELIELPSSWKSRKHKITVMAKKTYALSFIVAM